MPTLHPSNIRYFLGIGLPRLENDLFAEIKQQYHPEVRLSSPPHITIKPPFLMPNRSYLLEKLAKWASYQEPFRLVFDRIGSFTQPKYATVFLDPDQSEKLKALVSTLDREIAYLPETHNFHPHLTLAQRVPHENLAQVKYELRALSLKLKLLVNSLTLYQQSESGEWLLEREFVFAQSNSRTDQRA